MAAIQKRIRLTQFLPIRLAPYWTWHVWTIELFKSSTALSIPLTGWLTDCGKPNRVERPGVERAIKLLDIMSSNQQIWDKAGETLQVKRRRISFCSNSTVARSHVCSSERKSSQVHRRPRGKVGQMGQSFVVDGAGLPAFARSLSRARSS